MIAPFISASVCPLARTVRQHRMALGLTQAELARRMAEGTPRRAIQRLEAGKICMPSWSTLCALAAGLKLPLEVLLQAACPTCFADDDSDVPNFAQ
jgi:transcriptional regulator with XRE-family HTH domain